MMPAMMMVPVQLVTGCGGGGGGTAGGAACHRPLVAVGVILTMMAVVVVVALQGPAQAPCCGGPGLYRGHGDRPGCCQCRPALLQAGLGRGLCRSCGEVGPGLWPACQARCAVGGGRLRAGECLWGLWPWLPWLSCLAAPPSWHGSCNFSCLAAPPSWHGSCNFSC